MLAWVLTLPAAYAQDTRNVTEPVIPPSCFVLIAKLSAVGRTLPAPIPGPRPPFNGSNVAGAAVMGDGVINGRGWE